MAKIPVTLSFQKLDDDGNPVDEWTEPVRTFSELTFTDDGKIVASDLPHRDGFQLSVTWNPDVKVEAEYTTRGDYLRMLHNLCPHECGHTLYTVGGGEVCPACGPVEDAS